MTSRWSHTTLRFFLWFALLATGMLGAQQADPADQEYLALKQQAVALKNRDQLEEALQNLDRAASLAEEQLREKDLIDCYHLFAEIYLMMGRKETAEWNSARAGRMLMPGPPQAPNIEGR